MKLEGLKEIEAYFPAQENQEDIQIENIEENIFINEEDDNLDRIEEETIIENEDNETILEKTNKETNTTSLLNSIFKNHSLKKETCFLIHVIKDETSYKQIADLYKIDENKIKSINKNEQLYKGKLIFIPNK